ncbi:2-C-methyl-D-erythritol 4-phosphate cytidylyltransferase [Paeniglutamicibacter cryotolerans]|uniref:2-C-methyl-D-erythritol 4-phosphate cytidylyltransferase n=1 Tax=Paeniglutamicibacter cryotolerans TaxID=670079 RepID=A0A839QKS1_9MICC|nr:2-C-methyl-D-erythritol 4-phosphate cytidylyltransferase [Paeniglutamicibacter cryotolerans]MBB2995364.1 2-C-methyl-D-erythritol 4-phosphate cytidylyltransferase [Paeniglutamicibacter cryotolerans]
MPTEQGTPPPAHRTAVILVAAGSGTRLGYGIPKALVPLAGRSLLEHALDGLATGCPDARVIVVLPEGNAELEGICSRHRSRPVTCTGGATRNDSVRAGLARLEPGTEFVLVHDAARALTPPAVFERVADALSAGAEAVIPVLPVIDTIKSVQPASAGIGEGIVSSTVDRAVLRAVQTPQGFNAASLAAAHAAVSSWKPERAEKVTDDAMLMEMNGITVFTVHGSALGLKVTTKMDLLLAEALVANGYEDEA